jgi:hypothetical protein
MVVILMMYVRSDGIGGGEKTDTNLEVAVDISSMNPSSVSCREVRGVVGYKSGRT